MSYWVKWPVGHLDDPDVAQLPDSTWRRYSEAFLLAKACEDLTRPELRGFLPDVKAAAWRLHIEGAALADDFAQLALAGLMELRPHPDGGDRWFLTRYEETQRPATPAERMRHYRQRGAGTTKIDESVTKSNGHVTKSREEEKQSREKKKTAENSSNSPETATATNGLPPAAAAPSPDFADLAKTLARHGINGDKVARRLYDAGLRPSDSQTIAAHVSAAQRRGEGLGLAITRLLNGEPVPGAGANGRPALENQVPAEYAGVVSR